MDKKLNPQKVYIFILFISVFVYVYVYLQADWLSVNSCIWWWILSYVRTIVGSGILYVMMIVLNLFTCNWLFYIFDPIRVCELFNELQVYF